MDREMQFHPDYQIHNRKSPIAPATRASNVGDMLQNFNRAIEQSRNQLLQVYAAKYSEHTGIPVTEACLMEERSEDGKRTTFRFMPKRDQGRYVVLLNRSPILILPAGTTEKEAAQHGDINDNGQGRTVVYVPSYQPPEVMQAAPTAGKRLDVRG